MKCWWSPGFLLYMDYNYYHHYYYWCKTFMSYKEEIPFHVLVLSSRAHGLHQPPEFSFSPIKHTSFTQTKRFRKWSTSAAGWFNWPATWKTCPPPPPPPSHKLYCLLARCLNRWFCKYQTQIGSGTKKTNQHLKMETAGWSVKSFLPCVVWSATTQTRHGIRNQLSVVKEEGEYAQDARRLLKTLMSELRLNRK